LSALLNAVLLGFGLYRQKIWQPCVGWGIFSLRILLASGALCGVIYLTFQPVQRWLLWGLWQRVEQLAIIVVLGILAYGIGLVLMGLRWRHLQGPK
jgi:putative peptidoglycan lipid II flippase